MRTIGLHAPRSGGDTTILYAALAGRALLRGITPDIATVLRGELPPMRHWPAN